MPIPVATQFHEAALSTVLDGKSRTVAGVTFHCEDVQPRDPLDDLFTERLPCVACEGTGKSSRGRECEPCNGTGLQREESSADTNSPD